MSKLTQVTLSIPDLSVVLETSDKLINVKSYNTAIASCQVETDGALAQIHHPSSAIKTSDIEIKFQLPNNVTFPDTTLYQLPILQPVEDIAEGQAASLSHHLHMTPAQLLTAMGKDPLVDTFTLTPTDATLEFTVTLDDGYIATIATTSDPYILIGDLHPDEVSTFVWATGEVNIYFPTNINPAQPVTISYIFNDPEFIPTPITTTGSTIVTGAEENVIVTSDDLITALAHAEFNLLPTDSVLSFTATLIAGGTATITTTSNPLVLVGDLHATEVSTFDWIEGDADLYFPSAVDFSIPVEIVEVFTDSQANVEIMISYFHTLEYEGQKVFTGVLRELPVFPTSIVITATDKFGVLHELRDDGENRLIQHLPVIDEENADILDNIDTGTVNYITGEITVEFTEVVAHNNSITAEYAKLQEVVRYIPPSLNPPVITVRIPVQDWDNVATVIENALSGAEDVFKYRRW